MAMDVIFSGYCARVDLYGFSANGGNRYYTYAPRGSHTHTNTNMNMNTRQTSVCVPGVDVLARMCADDLVRVLSVCHVSETCACCCVLPPKSSRATPHPTKGRGRKVVSPLLAKANKAEMEAWLLQTMMQGFPELNMCIYL